MDRSARQLVYRIGRCSILVVLGLASAAARAQDAPPAAPAPDGNPPTVAVPPSLEGQPASGAGDREASAPPPVRPPWQDRLDEIDQRTRIVERQEELAREAAAAIVPAKPGAIIQTDENGFSISSPDRQYQIRFKGLIQFDGRRFFTSDSTLQNSDTFILRRIRPILDGTLLGLVDFRISPDFGNNTTAILDAYIDVHPRPWLRLRAGKFKEPVGLERLQADQDMPFIERALDSNLSPQRETGLELWGDIASGLVRYEAGVFNGNADGALTDVDSDHAKSFEGRVFVQPFNVDSLAFLGRLGLGIAASTGNERGVATLTAPNPWMGTFKSDGQQTIASYLTSTTDITQTVVAYGRHTRINPQLYYYNGPVGLLAEWVKEYQEVAELTTAGTPFGTGAYNNSAGHVTLSGVLGGDETFEGVKPHKPLDLAAGTFGALELALRYDWLNIDSAAFSTGIDPTKSVKKAQGFGVGLNWQLSRNIKVAGDYQQTSFTGGAKTGDRPTEKVLLGRFQVAF
jgi:phosphate-selective porin OprO and OprP